ncbi:TnsA endonuclease N-terminal domain-containing protein [Oculatella sp. LEGE 06141]|uniref:TnsA endonuclease N-terminal domain-containing protein n=1 Tax=Oculatella sp. LEGE 06141 TaxID=1828648 RepID=UPI00187ED1B3|nr:TnsA endonuclease N-terminal domain-containing protein [Oculatella sp. LEGE 06141]
MAKHRWNISKESIEQRIKEGRGQGEGFNYRPWLTVLDVTSRGCSHIIAGWKTDGRDHHLLSDGEKYCFLVYEWSKCILDIREQFPLPLEKTLAIAETAGIKHPVHPITKHPVVMTTDFLLTVLTSEGIVYHARTFKYPEELNVRNTRVGQLFEIERLYWQLANINWKIVTQPQLPGKLVDNMDHIHNFYNLKRINLTNEDVTDIYDWLTPKVNAKDTPLRDLTRDCDKALGFKGSEKGASLRAAYHFIANKRWNIDMNLLIEPCNILSIINTEGEYGDLS